MAFHFFPATKEPATRTKAPLLEGSSERALSAYPGQLSRQDIDNQN